MSRFDLSRRGLLTAFGGGLALTQTGPALAQAVVVRAADGYTVVFGLAELDPGVRTNRIILADTVDGAPLTAEDGPFRLVAEGDVRPARSVRQVSAFQIVRFPVPPAHP